MKEYCKMLGVCLAMGSLSGLIGLGVSFVFGLEFQRFFTVGLGLIFGCMIVGIRNGIDLTLVMILSVTGWVITELGIPQVSTGVPFVDGVPASNPRTIFEYSYFLPCTFSALFLGLIGVCVSINRIKRQ